MPIDLDGLVIGPTIDTFGESATFLPAAGGSFAIWGVFDEAYRDVAELESLEANSVMPVLGVRLSQMPVVPQQNDQVRMPSIPAPVSRPQRLYFVIDVRPDGHGWAKLMLGDTGQP